MTFSLKKHKDDLLFVPLGGAREIGMNLNLYHYKGKWIIIDFGIGFADDYLPGIDVVLPNIDFLHTIKDDIIALVLTHAHEDHMGAVPYLWHEINCPVYATPFTTAVLKAKMSEEGLGGKLKMIEIPSGSSIELGPFSIDLIDLTHSIPEMQALAIKTDKGTIIHTGDWKLDPAPMVGPASNEEALRQYGDKGVLAMVCDSTNVFVTGESGSESDVRDELKRLIATCKERVFVTSFASNIARVESIVRAGHEAGRKIALAGRSLHRITTAAKESGYLTDVEFISDRDVMKLPRNEVMAICTGCQGEPRAALSKIAQAAHPTLRAQAGDMVIFSAKMIPGNETRVRWMYNQFAGMGVDIVTEKDVPIHVSGHPARDELERMYQLVKPQIAVPVHGEAMHIHEHALFAKSMQVPTVIESTNGVVVVLASDAHTPGIIANVPSGYIALDGVSMIPADSPVIRQRRKLREDGNITISVVIDKHNEVVSKPIITGPGSLDRDQDADLIEELCDLIADAVESPGKKGKRASMEEKIRSAIRKAIGKELGKKPVLEIHIHQV